MIFLILSLILIRLDFLGSEEKKRKKKIVTVTITFAKQQIKMLGMILICWVFFMKFLILLLIYGPTRLDFLGSKKYKTQNCYCNYSNCKTTN